VTHGSTGALPSGGRARSQGTRGSAGDHLGREARCRAEGHMTVPELTSVRRRRPRPHDTWQCQNPPWQGGEVRGRETRGCAGAHLCREVRSEATGYVIARGCTPYPLS
jgi:hypothetical protein